MRIRVGGSGGQMTGSLKRWTEDKLWRQKLRRWQKATEAALGETSPEAMRQARLNRRSHERELTTVLHAKPQGGAEWHWSPPLWQSAMPSRQLTDNRTELDPAVTLFHDSPSAQITASSTQAPLTLTTVEFEGSFLSLVLDLPQRAVEDLRLHHVFTVDPQMTLSRPLEVFVRLNIKNGPNVEQLVREIASPVTPVEFDLFYSRLNEKRVEKAWVDMIFERPSDSIIALHGITISRRRRAEL